MALSSDWEMGMCLEWYSELPLEGRPRESPIFLIQDTECFFLLCRERNACSYYCYYVYLKTEDACAQLKSFPLTITMLYNNGFNSFHRSEINFQHSDHYVYCFTESYFANLKVNLNGGVFVRFLFQFQNQNSVVEPLFFSPSETNLDEKATQANLMSSLETDVEYLSLDFSSLLKTGDHTDVQLMCNGGNIPAHKAILAARSEVFSDMFRGNTEESKSGLINMSTTELSVMELCLEFIYKGKFLNLPVEMAANLYVLGHVLKISSLTNVCADLMIYNLCEDNYISHMVLADKYDDDYFKGGVIDYIFDHVYLLKSRNWIKFSNEHLKTANQVFQKCILKLI